MFTTILYLLALISNPTKPEALGASSVPIASRSFSLEDRYNVPSVNQVFKDNILLTMAYMDGRIRSKADINWDEVEKPFHSEFTLKPEEEFAFHDKTLPAYGKNMVKTTNSHYVSYEGFKSDGWLVGDGVCHIASLINWAARDAGLSVYAPSNHNFAKINEVPKEYGVAILSTTPNGNLYISNNKDVPITFSFNYDGTNLTVSVLEEKA